MDSTRRKRKKKINKHKFKKRRKVSSVEAIFAVMLIDRLNALCERSWASKLHLVGEVAQRVRRGAGTSTRLHMHIIHHRAGAVLTEQRTEQSSGVVSRCRSAAAVGSGDNGLPDHPRALRHKIGWITVSVHRTSRAGWLPVHAVQGDMKRWLRQRGVVL